MSGKARVRISRGVLLCGAGGLALAGLRGGLPLAGSKPLHQSTRVPAPGATQPERVTADTAAETAASAAGPVAVRDLFRPAVQKTPALARPKQAAKSARVKSPRSPAPRLPAVTPPPAAPAPGPTRPALALVGVFVLGDQPRVVLQDTTTRMSRTVAAGEEAFGFRVTQIAGDAVTVSHDGTTYSLPIQEGAGTRVATLMEGIDVNLAEPGNAKLASLPFVVRAAVRRVLPAGGEVREVRPDTEDGQSMYRIDKLVDGRLWQLRVGTDGTVIRWSQELPPTAVPAAVLAAANHALPGYQVNPTSRIRLRDRSGQRYYQIEVRQAEGEGRTEVRVSPTGVVMRD